MGPINVSLRRAEDLSEHEFPKDTILQGDSLKLMSELPPSSFDCIFCDPPYNLQLNQNVLQRPDQSKVQGVREQWDKFQSLQDYDTFTEAWLTQAKRLLKPTGTIWIIGTYHNIFRIGRLLQDLGFWILNDIIWHKLNPMPNFQGKRFSNAHETLIWASTAPNAARYTFNYTTLKASNEDIQMRSDWFIPICRGKERLADEHGKKIHPTQKPEALLERILISSTRAGDLVLDPFFGTGTTGACCKKLGRHYVGIDQSYQYCSAAQNRISAVTPYPKHYYAQNETKPLRVPFLSLLEHGCIRAGDALVNADESYEALVRADGTLTSGTVTGSIHKIGALLQSLPSCNGWHYWYHRKGSEKVSINDYREELRVVISNVNA